MAKRVRPFSRLPALSWLPGQRPAQEAACPAVGNRVMSQPSSATITSAVRRATPGIVSSRASCAAWCLLWVPDGSALKNAGDGRDVGATIIQRYTDGALHGAAPLGRHDRCLPLWCRGGGDQRRPDSLYQRAYVAQHECRRLPFPGISSVS